MIDRVKAEKAFMEYADNYDTSDVMIKSKIDHTFRVSENADRIARSLKMNDEDIDLAYMSGLLHDFGRFEQVRRYGTFIDSHSVDHAELGADILFNDGKIKLFYEAGFKEEAYELMETAIRQHNKLKLQDGLDDRTETFCNILRDSDKLDIFRVILEMPFEQRIGKSRNLFEEKEEASEECMEYVRLHRCIPRNLIHSIFEVSLSHLCFAFELVFEESRTIAVEQGYLKMLFSETDESGKPLWKDKEISQLKIVRNEVEKCWGKVL